MNSDQIFDLIAKEEKRQQETLSLIPSENYTSKNVREAVGSVLMNKYAEGYPGKRYYQGMEFIDQIEILCQERAKKLFNVPHANVQPYSGSPANAAVYLALLNPGDTLMGLSLSHGGHLTHGFKVSFSGKFFNGVQFDIDESKPDYFDFAKIRSLALENRPKVIVVGTTAFSRNFNWEKFSQIANEVDAYLLADISHLSGLIAGGAIPSPVPFVDIVMTTTHKSLRGPRGAMIMVTNKGLQKDPELSTKIDKAVFPGLQGGPHMHTIAGIAVALRFAQGKPFQEYAHQVIKNAKVLSETLIGFGFTLVTGGTDNHLMVLDLRNINIPGKEAAEILEKNGLVVNKNTIPNDPNPPSKPSGIRLGTPAVTTRGMKEPQMRILGGLIKEVLMNGREVKKEVLELTKEFPYDF